MRMLVRQQIDHRKATLLLAVLQTAIRQSEAHFI